jgi:hypothetical protein
MEDSRLPASKTFPVNLHSRHRSEAARPSPRSNAEERQPWPRRLFIDTAVEEQPQPQAQQAPSEKSSAKSEKSKHSTDKSHRYSKSRENNYRLPRAVNQIASAGGARNLLPNRSFQHRRHWSQQIGEERHRDKYRDRDKEREGDFGFLRPTNNHVHDSSRSRFGSRSPSAHNRSQSTAGSMAEDDSDSNRKLSLMKGADIKTMDDLKQAQKERERGEE